MMREWRYLLMLIMSLVLFDGHTASPPCNTQQAEEAEARLEEAIHNPEYLLNHWIELPISSKVSNKKTFHLTLREAILLALRYNPNIQNAELDRIIQRYQLRLAHNEFELQYALAGTAMAQNTHYTGIGNTQTHNYLLTPEVDLKTKLGGQFAVKMDSDIATYGNYNPLLNISFTQPLLRGFGPSVTEIDLKNALDQEWLNKLNLQQSVIDQVTQVIIAYRALILSGNTLDNQRRQLKEAQELYEINEKKIQAGQLEPTANIQQSYQIESLNLMVEDVDNQFKTAAFDLLQALGLDPDLKLAVPSDIHLDKLIIPDEQKSTAEALLHNAAYLALKIALKADERAYELAKNQQLWQLDLNANMQMGSITDVDNLGSGSTGIYNGRSVTQSAGITLTVPFHDISRRQQLISAKVRLEKDKLNLIAAKRALIINVKNTISGIRSQAKRYELTLKQVELALKSFTLEKKKRQAGIASGLDVNQTQNQLLQAQMGLIRAKIAYVNQLSSLQRIMGTTLEDWKIKLRYGE